MTIALLAPLLLAAGTADVSTLDCPAIVAKDDYTDDTDLCLTAPIAKPYFEEGMACIGKYQGTRAMQVRITDFITDEQKKKEWTDQTATGDKLADQIDKILTNAKADPDVDAAAGQAAYDAARAPLDAASSLGGNEQIKMWQADPQMSKRCVALMNFFGDNLATRADERARNSDDTAN